MRRGRHPQASNGPILVLDPNATHTLATVRGLGQAGWRVMMAGSEPKADAFAATSKYVESYQRLPDTRGEATPVEVALLELVHRHKCQAVVICSDATIARLRDLDIGVPTIPQMDRGLDRLTDKITLGLVCSDAGVMYPRTWSTESVELRVIA